MYLKAYFLVAILFAVTICDGQKLNNRPIVGILTQPTGDSLKQYGSSYIAASYVKYVESGGGRVVPIFHNSTTEELRDLFSKINGVLFPGGGASLDMDTDLYKSAKLLYDMALKANDKGDYFPIFGHCMGFELLAIITSQDENILTGVDAENYTIPLNFTADAKSSRWLLSASKDILSILATQPVTMNNHVECVTPADFSANPYLPSFYSVLATNMDRHGKQFVSLWEGKKYPIYGMQWHAEKPQFEWNPQEVINHTKDSIKAMQYFPDFLVNEARKSQHHFATIDEEYQTLIYNFSPLFTQEITGDFTQCYVF